MTRPVNDQPPIAQPDTETIPMFGSPGPETVTPKAAATAVVPAVPLGAPGLQVKSETAAAVAVATQARATVEARYLMALQRPRNWLDVGHKLNTVMRRPGVAKAAEYSIPRGGKRVTGPTIRFAEECFRAAGNILTDVQVTHDDEERRIVRINMTDLENNWTITRDVVLYRTMERRSVPQGETPLSSRVNSEGVLVFRLAITEEELLFKQNALVSRVMRTDGLRLIPTDVKEDALQVALETRADQDAKDPAAAIKWLTAKFFRLGITAEQLVEFLGKDLPAITRPEAEHLTGLAAAIAEGDTTWEEVMAERGRKPARGGPSGAAGLKDKLAKEGA